MSKKATLKDIMDAGSIPNEYAHQQRSIDLTILRSWLYQKQAHYISKHRYCDDVKESMKDLISEFDTLILENNPVEEQKGATK